MKHRKKNIKTQTKKKHFSPIVFLQNIWNVCADESFKVSYVGKNPEIFVAIRTTGGCGILELVDKKFELPQNSLIIFHSKQPTLYYTKSDYWDFKWFEFQISPVSLQVEKVYLFPISSKEKNVTSHITTLQTNDSDEIVIQGYFSLLYAFWLSGAQKPTKVYEQLCDDALQYINSHLSEKILVEDLAKLCYMSRRHFQTIFKLYTKKSPSQYIQDLRLNTAKTLLMSTEETQAEIAEQTGFNNLHYFHKCFKKFVGVSPGEYRKK